MMMHDKKYHWILREQTCFKLLGIMYNMNLTYTIQTTNIWANKRSLIVLSSK